MKYLKLFENNNKKEELEELIPEINDLCQDLKDHGFIVDIKLANTYIIQFPENISKIPYNSNIDKYEKNLMSCICITISNYHKKFNIDDIINDLLFINSYTKEELNLKVNHYKYYDSLKSVEYYCKNIPKYININTITIYFIKA